MPQQVTIRFGGYSITVSSLAGRPDGSVDVRHFGELTFDPVEVVEALEALAANEQAIVNCMFGQNRSPTVAILYLWWRSGEPLGDVFRAVQAAF